MRAGTRRACALTDDDRSSWQHGISSRDDEERAYGGSRGSEVTKRVVCGWKRWRTNLGWHTGVGRTLSFTMTHMAALATSFDVLACTETRVHGHWFLDDQAIFDQLAYTLTCRRRAEVCKADRVEWDRRSCSNHLFAHRSRVRTEARRGQMKTRIYAIPFLCIDQCYERNSEYYIRNR